MDAVDGHNFYVLLCSACSTTCCCTALWTFESNYDYSAPSAETVIANLDQDVDAQFSIWSFFLPDGLLAMAKSSIHPF